MVLALLSYYELRHFAGSLYTDAALPFFAHVVFHRLLLRDALMGALFAEPEAATGMENLAIVVRGASTPVHLARHC